MGYVISKIVGVLLTPGALLGLLTSVGTVLLWGRWWRLGRGLLTVCVGLLAVVMLTPAETLLTARLENRFPANPPLPAHIDGIIVLGGVVDQYLSAVHEQISLNDAADRLLEAVRLARAHPEAKVLFSGGSADPLRPDPREADLAGQAMIEMGLDPTRLVIEDNSRNTYENAVFSERLVQPRRGDTWVLITSARHMPRSVGVFRRIGWPVIPYPVDFQSGAGPRWANTDMVVQRLLNLTRALHEWFGLLFYRASGWTDSLLPAP